MVSAEEFAARLGAEFGIPAPPPLGASLTDDLGLDSLDHFDLVLFSEELAGTVDPAADSDFPLLVTVEDAYTYYAELCAAGTGRAPTSP